MASEDMNLDKHQSGVSECVQVGAEMSSRSEMRVSKVPCESLEV